MIESTYFRMLKVYIKYHLKQPVPFIGFISPTLKCNQRCSYCEVRSDNSKFLSLSNMKQFIFELNELGTPFIGFSGGEPLLNPNTLLAAKFAKSLGMKVHLSTNLQLMNKDMVNKMLESFDIIRISVNGVNGTHDKIVGTKGAYHRLKSKIYQLKNKDIRIGINFLMLKENEGELKKVYDEFRDYIDFISPIYLFGFQNKKETIQHKIPQLKLGISEEFIKLNKTICDAGKLYIILRHDSIIAACPFKYSGKNILGEIGKSKIKDIIKKRISPQDINCSGCKSICTSEISRIFRLSPYQLCKNFIKLKRTYFK